MSIEFEHSVTVTVDVECKECGASLEADVCRYSGAIQVESCDSCGDDRENKGFREGHQQGYTEGKEEGYDEGFDRGFDKADGRG